jgi:hypothetical protein
MTMRTFNLLVAILIPVATILVYRDLFGLWFTDTDAFSLISTGQFSSVGDIVNIFTSPTMLGLMPNALYFRPLSSLSWGIDAKIWGLNPLGYHLTDLAIHIANSFLLFFLVRNTAQRYVPGVVAKNRKVGQNDIAALAAAFLFAIHPIAQEVVPAIARRADLLHGMFLLLMLHSLHNAMTRHRNVDIVLATLFALLGFTSKDPALLAPAFALLFVFSFSYAKTINGRLADCARLCWPLVVAAAMYLGLRTLVLGGLGGYTEIQIWAHPPFWQNVAQSTGSVFCAMFFSGDLNSCARFSLDFLRGIAAVVVTSFVLLGWRASRVSAPYPPIQFIAFALLSAFTIFSLHVVLGPPAFIRMLYVVLLFMSIVIGWGLVILPQGILALGRLHNIRVAERVVHMVAGIILIVAMASEFRGAWSGQYIKDWDTEAEIAKLAITDLANGLESVPAGSVVYLVNVPFKRAPLRNAKIKWVNPYPLRERPMLLEHSMQGYVDLAFPDKRLEVIVLSYIEVHIDNLKAVESMARFQPEPAHLEIEVGAQGRLTREIWNVSYPRQSKWRENSYSGIEGKRGMTIELNPDVSIEDNAVFFVYTGDRAVKKGTSPWVVNHRPSN